MKMLIVTSNLWVLPVKWLREFDIPALKVIKKCGFSETWYNKGKTSLWEFHSELQNSVETSS